MLALELSGKSTTFELRMIIKKYDDCRNRAIGRRAHGGGHEKGLVKIGNILLERRRRIIRCGAGAVFDIRRNRHSQFSKPWSVDPEA